MMSVDLHALTPVRCGVVDCGFLSSLPALTVICSVVSGLTNVVK